MSHLSLVSEEEKNMVDYRGLTKAKPRPKRKNLTEQLEEMRANYENERERADILSDKLDTLKEEYNELEGRIDPDDVPFDIDEVQGLLEDLKSAKWHKDIGAVSGVEDYNEVVEKLSEVLK